jgi:hypothetical protein
MISMTWCGVGEQQVLSLAPSMQQPILPVHAAAVIDDYTYISKNEG